MSIARMLSSAGSYLRAVEPQTEREREPVRRRERAVAPQREREREREPLRRRERAVGG
jgi:hypothetical protein